MTERDGEMTEREAPGNSRIKGQLVGKLDIVDKILVGPPPSLRDLFRIEPHLLTEELAGIPTELVT